ncbi:MAG TPA: heparinase II/III family protein [Streptosporangiaceae bacterium]|nr:heparinase II/III family protein [Streptosporangiaceae bacterium]
MTEDQISPPGGAARRAATRAAAASAEVAWRARDQVLRALWWPRRVRPGQLRSYPRPAGERGFAAGLPPGTALCVPGEARAAVIDSAERLLRGEWEVLGVVRNDLARPDWFRDPVTGRRFAQDRYAFGIGRRGDDPAGGIRQIWELSRLHHLTLLATAWFLTHDERYARTVADHLGSWWRENTFLSGVNWTSGAELGIRLISLAWIRRLLDEWPGVAGLFERDAVALRQIRWHQQYLAAFPSRTSSAGHDAIAEAAGQLVASCAFPWFRESERWRRKSALALERRLLRGTLRSDTDREPASDSVCFVVGLGFVAAVEAGVSGHPLRPDAWARLCALADSAAALVDARMRPPREGDSEEGCGLLLDPPAPNPRPSMLALAEALVGRQDWWPWFPADAASSIVGALAGSRRQVEGRPSQRPSRFADAGITLLRASGKDEIWCRCDGSPHGYPGIAGRAGADALAVEVRYAGVDILANPGTFCRSGEDGPAAGGRPAHAREIELLDDGDIARWTAEHDEYAALSRLARHRRSVLLDRASRSIDIIDQIDGGRYGIRLAFLLGPDVRAKLEESCAVLDWPAASVPGAARLELPPELRWSLHRGEAGAIPGWHSQAPGHRGPAVTLLGCGHCVPGLPLITRLEFLEAGKSRKSAVSRQAISWTASVVLSGKAPEIQAEAR